MFRVFVYTSRPNQFDHCLSVISHRNEIEDAIEAVEYWITTVDLDEIVVQQNINGVETLRAKIKTQEDLNQWKATLEK